MITFYSIRSKITIIFIISVLLLVAVAYNMFNTYIHSQKRYIVIQEMASIRYLFEYYFKTHKLDLVFLKSQNFRLIEDKDEKATTLNRLSKREKDRGYQVFKHQRKRILFLKYDNNIFLLENMNKIKPPNDILFVFLTLLGLLLFLYIMIINSLKPLSKLKNQIYTFSQGNLDIECRSNKKDEIAQVANEFHHAVQKIKELKHSRQLLLRAIMHELKTPIAKGKLVTEMTINQKYKEKLHNIFNRLNLLIDEFAKIEMITSKNFNTNLKDYKMTDIIDASIDMLMLDNPHNHIKIEIKKDYIIQADFQLLPLAIKNLLDNAIKYNSTKSITIVINNAIEITNIGSQLDEPLQNYYTPFRTKSHGLGLGLYIVKNILDIHKLQLIYSYKTPLNKFMIIAKS